MSAEYWVDGEQVDLETFARESEKRCRSRLEAVMSAITLRQRDE